MDRVAVFGTFDIFHPGHISFLKQAKKLGDFLLVVVARDQSVKEAKDRWPREAEIKRLRAVRQSTLADKAILGSKTNNYFRTLRTNKIGIIALGYDQKPSIYQLRKQLRRHRLNNLKIIRLKSYNPAKYKSSKL